jgi:hypothetical protein
MPMMHEMRFNASLSGPAYLRPAVCLQYAMWTHVASASEKYKHLENVFYQRARKYAQNDELGVSASLSCPVIKINERHHC